MALQPELSKKIMREYRARLKQLQTEKTGASASEEDRAQTVVVYSAAGGAGTTFLSCNLAKKMRDLTGKSTLVVDADFQLPVDEQQAN